MTGNERAQHDWFDQELDRLLTGVPEAIDGEDELVQAAVLMQRLDLNQQPEPDELFILELEKQLMPNVSHLAVTQTATYQNPIRTIYEQLVSRITMERTQHRRTSRLASAFSIALLFAVIAATAFVAINNGENGDHSPTASSALATGEASEPTPTVAIVVDRGTTPDSSEVTTANTLVERWRTGPLKDSDTYGGRIAASGGILYRVLDDRSGQFSKVQALSATTGEELWTTSFSEVSTIVANGSNVYVTSADDLGSSEITALIGETGAVAWIYPLLSTVVTSTIQADLDDPNASFLLIKDRDNFVTSLDTSSGDVVWRQRIGNPSSPSDMAIAPLETNGEVVIAQATNGSLNALDFSSGEVLWTVTSDEVNDIAISGDVVSVITRANSAAEGDVYSIVAFGINDGTELWSRRLEGYRAYVWSGLTAAEGGFAVIAQELISTDGSAAEQSLTSTGENRPPSFAIVYGVDASTGETFWSSAWNEMGVRQSGGPVLGLSDAAFALETLVAEDGTLHIIVISYDGGIGVLSKPGAGSGPSASREIAPIPIAFPIQMKYDLRDAVTDDSAVYVEIGDGTIIAFGLPDTNP
jgi:outer membrane protein assembly factor BamB